MKQGDNYYIMSHAYHHYIGEIVEIFPRTVVIKNGIKVHSCQRNWTEFFKNGCGDDTKFDVMPDLSEVPYELGVFPWKHAIPRK
jgi:hypothetical protein